MLVVLPRGSDVIAGHTMSFGVDDPDGHADICGT
jgi:hypothetical protein